jgi:LytS/YehU family sensor histidine kinase
VLPDEYTITFGAVIYEFLNTLGFTFGPITIKFSVDWFREHRQKTELLTQNQASELALLRSQINPHFLFNTLNNIYALVYKKSDEAPEAVMKLSGIMRYMLDDSTGDKVELKKEIEYLNNYIELQKLRIADKEFVEFVINGEPENKYITPMIFIPFIENAFKHCDKSHEPPGIIIQIDILENKILLYSKNYYTNEEPQSKDLTGGIGLANVRRRLELLYPNRHKLAINSAENTFVVELELNEL